MGQRITTKRELQGFARDMVNRTKKATDVQAADIEGRDLEIEARMAQQSVTWKHGVDD